MFENIGGKIKAVAQVVCWLGIIVSVICGIIMITQGGGTSFIGFLIMILGSLFSWIGSFMTYGFGQLIQNTDKLVAEKNSNSTNSAETIINTNDKIVILNQWREHGLITEEEYNQKMESLK